MDWLCFGNCKDISIDTSGTHWSVSTFKGLAFPVVAQRAAFSFPSAFAASSEVVGCLHLCS
jgi:hypothetical protein